MIEACQGNEALGAMLYYFSHWSNDILSVAAGYGIGVKKTDENERGFEVVELPPKPETGKYWWNQEDWEWTPVVTIDENEATADGK